MGNLYVMFIFRVLKGAWGGLFVFFAYATGVRILEKYPNIDYELPLMFTLDMLLAAFFIHGALKRKINTVPPAAEEDFNKQNTEQLKSTSKSELPQALREQVHERVWEEGNKQQTDKRR